MDEKKSRKVRSFFNAIATGFFIQSISNFVDVKVQ